LFRATISPVYPLCKNWSRGRLNVMMYVFIAGKKDKVYDQAQA
jgi:hypothetical protein